VVRDVPHISAKCAWISQAVVQRAKVFEIFSRKTLKCRWCSGAV
jgi:hypothetical protein